MDTTIVAVQTVGNIDVTVIVQTIADVISFVQKHPFLSGAVASVITASETLPFVKKIQASGVLQLVVNIIKVITQKKGA